MPQIQYKMTREEWDERELDVISYRQAFMLVAKIRDEVIKEFSEKFDPNKDASVWNYFATSILDSIEEYLVDRMWASRTAWRSGRSKTEYPAQSVEEYFEYVDYRQNQLTEV